MLIQEMSSADVSDALTRIGDLVVEIEEMSPMVSLGKIQRLRKCLSFLPPLELSDDQRLLAWRLSYRIWNISVDMVNNVTPGQEIGEDHAELRQIASELLLIAGTIGKARTSLFKMSTFFYKTGCTWHNVKCYLKAAACYEKAFEICMKEDGSVSQPAVDTEEEKSFFFELLLARAKTAWELASRPLACSLLGRARGLLSTIADRHQELAEQYLHFGKSLLAKEDVESQADSVKYMENGLDICSEALNSDLDESVKENLEKLKQRILRHLAAGHLQNENFDSALRCVGALRLTSDHPSTAYFALKALTSLGRCDEAEQELFKLIGHDADQIDVYVSALEIFLQYCGQLNTVEKVFFTLIGRFGSNKELPPRVLEKLLRREPSTDVDYINRVELALRIARDEKVVTAIMAEAQGLSRDDKLMQSAKEKQCVHAILWTSGSEHFQARMYRTSLRLFEASMLYLDARDSDSCMLQAKSLRVLCLCHLALSQFERAAEVIEQAEKQRSSSLQKLSGTTWHHYLQLIFDRTASIWDVALLTNYLAMCISERQLDPSTATIFLKFKIALHTRDETDACKQVDKMLKCSDLEPEFLTLACHEAIACKNVSAAIAALSSMLSLYSSERVLATGEVTVLRNLILLLIREKKNRCETLKYFKHAQKRLEEVGSEKFFGSGGNEEREAKWFAGASWNQATEAGKEQDWKACFELYTVSSEFYTVLPQSLSNLQTLQTALLLCVSALLAGDDECDNESLKLAKYYLDKCRKVHGSLVAKLDPGATVDENYEIYINLLSFELSGRAKDHAGQLTILKRCSSLPGFKAEHFYKMGLEACNKKDPSVEVATLAFRMCLNVTLSTPTPNYEIVGTVIRKMINLESMRSKDSFEVLELYKQAHQIVLGLGNTVYPQDEAQWLVATAWNRSALYVKLLRFSEAELWMGVALDLLTHVPAMEIHRPSMMESLGELLRQKGSMYIGE